MRCRWIIPQPISFQIVICVDGCELLSTLGEVVPPARSGLTLSRSANMLTSIHPYESLTASALKVRLLLFESMSDMAHFMQVFLLGGAAPNAIREDSLLFRGRHGFCAERMSLPSFSVILKYSEALLSWKRSFIFSVQAFRPRWACP